MTFKFIDKSAATKIIDAIPGQYKRLNEGIQKVAALAVLHANAEQYSGNADTGIRLFAAVKEAGKRDCAKLAVFLCKHGNFEYDKGTKTLRYSKRDDVVTDPAMIGAIMEANHWTEAIPDQNPADFLDAAKKVAQLVKAVEKEIAEGRGDKIVWGTTKLDEVIKAVIVDKAEFVEPSAA